MNQGTLQNLPSQSQGLQVGAAAIATIIQMKCYDVPEGNEFQLGNLLQRGGLGLSWKIRTGPVLRMVCRQSVPEASKEFKFWKYLRRACSRRCGVGAVGGE